MSRCFPFPPPGYEKKARVDDLDLLKKEKQREKKHKKEKREGKDRREKDKSDGKHKGNKNKKKDKDKSSNLDEKRLPGISEDHIGEKVSNEKRFPEQSGGNGEKVSNEKRFAGRFEDHYGDRISNEKRLPMQSKGHGGEKIVPNEKDKHRNIFSNDRKSAGQVAGYNGEKVIHSIPLAEDTRDSKYDQELDGRVREEGKGPGNDYVNKFTGADQKRDEGMLESVSKATGNGAGWNGKEKDKRDDDKKINGQGIRDETHFSGNSMVQNLIEGIQPRDVEIARPFEKNVERKMGGKEKTEKKGGDDKQRNKHKNKDREKKSQGNDEDREKERKKEKKENKTMSQDKVKESIKNDVIVSYDVKAPNLSEDSKKSVATEGNLRKRKDVETNGFLHGNENTPNKLRRPTLPSHSLPKNERILEPCQTSIPSSSDRQGTASTLKADSKNQKVNGTLEEAQPFPVSLAKPSLATAQIDPIAEAPRKTPHPDSKFLSQIISVPKMEELSDSDEQEWLFSRSGSLSKKSKMESFRGDEAPLVWSEARRIESADVYALPYVIPY